MSMRKLGEGRVCRLGGCERRVEAGHAYCRRHADDPEAVAFRRELAGAAAYVGSAVEAVGPEQLERGVGVGPDELELERAEAFRRFRARAAEGDFDRLLEAPTKRMLEQAAAIEGFGLEIGALRLGLMRVLADETDPTRTALALARLSNAAVRARMAQVTLGARETSEEAWLDRVSEAMLGYTLEGKSFFFTPTAFRARMRQVATADRWEAARRLKEGHEAGVAEMNARTDALAERMGWRSSRPGVGDGEPGWDDRGADDVEPGEEDEEEDRLDRELAQRIADQRAAAVARAERDAAMSAYAVAGLRRFEDGSGWQGDEEQPEGDAGRPARRVARGRR